MTQFIITNRNMRKHDDILLYFRILPPKYPQKYDGANFAPVTKPLLLLLLIILVKNVAGRRSSEFFQRQRIRVSC